MEVTNKSVPVRNEALRANEGEVHMAGHQVAYTITDTPVDLS